MRSSILLVTLALAMAAACGGKSDAPGSSTAAPVGSSPASPAADPNAVAKANEVFAQRCTPCHGEKGHGDGAASASLTPKPRNFSDPSWQKSVTDDYIEKIIKVGGAAVGKSPAMPSNPDLQNAAVLAALKDKVRSFASQ